MKEFTLSPSDTIVLQFDFAENSRIEYYQK
jgi:hypothetical protein